MTTAAVGATFVIHHVRVAVFFIHDHIKTKAQKYIISKVKQKEYFLLYIYINKHLNEIKNN